LRITKLLNSLYLSFFRILQEGQIAIVDESFEQELWHMGSEPAIFLTVDMWHPDLTQDRIKKLGPLS
jgi:hypothetical protein